MSSRLLLVLVLAVIALGCGEVVPAAIHDAGTNDDPCESNAECGAESPICDQETLECRGCQEPLECADHPAGGLCESSSGQCVECLVNADCGAMTCDQETYQCRACMTHADCDSDVCGGGGACVPESEVLYVDRESNNPGPDCTRDKPCATTAQATALLNEDKEWIRVLPSTQPYQEFAAISYGSAKVCAEDAVFDLQDFGGAAQPFFRIEPGGGATIIGGTYANSPLAALSCGTNQATQARLVVRAGTFDGVVSAVSGSGCDIEITDSIIRGSTGPAIVLAEEMSISEVVVKRNRIVDGSDGAVDVQAAKLTLHNNLIAGNLKSDALTLYRVVDLSGDLFVDVVNNTIHSNGGPWSESELESTAFWCAGVDNPPVISNNIIWDNDLSNVFIECFGDEVVTNILDLEESQKPNYPGNTFQPPLLENPGANDFRPRPISPAIDSANPTYAPDHDIDRNPRTVGEGPDIGAFERQ